MMTDGLLTEECLREALRETPFKFFPQCESTMDIARQWAVDGAPDGAVVIAEEQTAGRGRFGRAWHAPAGTSVMLSVILRPTIRSEYMPVMSMAAALTVRERILQNSTIPSTRLDIKWPNDVLIDGLKVAGILSETVWEGDRFAGMIIGIGLNVYTDFTGTPYERIATSILVADGDPNLPPRTTFIKAIADEMLEFAGLASNPDGPTLIYHEWARYLSTLGQSVRVTNRTTREIIEGEAVGVNPFGTLQIRDANRPDVVHNVMAGDVTLSDSVRDEHER